MGWRGPEEPFNEALASIQAEMELIDREIDSQCYMENFKNIDMKELIDMQNDFAQLIENELDQSKDIMLKMVLGKGSTSSRHG